MAWYEEWAQAAYDKRPLSGEWFESERPLLLQTPDGTYISLLEAAMKDYTRGKFKLANDNVLQVAMYDCADIISPYDTPWRVIIAGEKAVDLINHKDLVLNLNEPSKITQKSLLCMVNGECSMNIQPFYDLQHCRYVVYWRK
jgi:alpha-glucosidase